MNTISLETRIQQISALGLKYNGGEDAYILQDIYVPVLDLKTLADADYADLHTGITNHMAANPDQYPIANTALAVVEAQEQTDQPEETIIDRALSTLQSGTEVLRSNQLSSQSAKKAARALLDKIKAAGKMTPELYEDVIALRKKIGSTEKALNERRKPFTRAMDLIKSEFTACENELKETVQTTEAYELKIYADDWVKQCALEKKRQDDEIERKRLKNQEAIDRKAAIERSLITHFNDYLAGKKQLFTNRFNAIKLENYENECKFFTTVNFQYAKEHFDLFKYTASSQRLTPEEQQEVFASVVTESKYQELCNLYFDAMISLKVEKVDLLASKKNELDRIREFEIEQENERIELARIENERKTANEAQRKHLEEQQLKLDTERKQREEDQRKLDEERRQREEDERKLLEEQQRKQQDEQQSKVNVSASQATSTNLFASQAEASNITVAAPKTKTGYEVEVLSQIAWLEVFNFWFQNEGAGWDADKMRKKFDFMLTSMEKLALKNGTMLESDNVKYHETYAAKK